MSRTKSLTEQTIFELLKRRWPWPGYVVLPQVANCTGDACRRYADAVVLSVYPSRGIYAIGVEIKVSRSDWQKELADPEKAEAILKHCLYWYVAAPKKLIDPAEVPEKWGLIECDGRGTRIAKRAPRLMTAPLSWEFVAAITRRLAENVVTREEHERRLQEERDRCAEDAQKAMKLREVQYRLRMLECAVSAFEKASGVKITDRWEGEPIGEAVAEILKARKVDGYSDTIGHVIQILRDVIASLEQTKTVLERSA